MMVSLVACGSDKSATSRNAGQGLTIDDVITQSAETEDNNDVSADVSGERKSGVDESAPAPEVAEDELPKSTTEGIDIDLTQLSSTMVYSEVYNMMMSPEAYVGKTVKMSGAFSYCKVDETGKEYYACIIQDATACCSQGIEFVLDGEHVYPDDYPEIGSDVCVVGVFDTYEEDGGTYCTLKNAKMM